MGGGSGQSELQNNSNLANTVSLTVGGDGGGTSFVPNTSQSQTQKASTDAGWGASVGVGIGGDGNAGGVGVGTGNAPTGSTPTTSIMKLINPTNIALAVAVYFIGKKL